MKYIVSLLVPAILFFATGCNNNKTEQKTLPVDSNVVKVYVDKTGQVTADGNIISLVALDSAFSKLKTNKGTVYYSRDDIQADPTAESMKVMELIIKYSLPVRFYSDKTFSTIVTPN